MPLYEAGCCGQMHTCHSYLPVFLVVCEVMGKLAIALRLSLLFIIRGSAVYKRTQRRLVTKQEGKHASALYEMEG